MREQQRVHYLQAMGVVQWVPRLSAMHDLRPRYTPSLIPTEAGGGHAEHPSAERLLAEQPVALQELLSSVGVESAKTLQPEAVTEPTAQHVDSSNVPHFSLFFIQVLPNTLWVCDQVSDCSAVSSLAYQAYRALGYSLGFIPHPVEFRWPFLMQSSSDQSASVAMNALRAQWQHFADMGAEHVVSFGIDAQHWLSALSLQSLHSHPSIAEVMNQPHLKRQLWLQLLKSAS